MFFALFFFTVFFLVEVEVKIIHVFRCEELVQISSFLFGRTSGTSCAVYEAADFAHLQQFILVGCRDVFHHIRNQFGAHPFLDGLQHLEGIGNGWFSDLYHIPRFDRPGWFGLRTVDGDSSFLQASAAIVLVLKIRAAHIHLSILASGMCLFVVILVHGIVQSGQAETFDDFLRHFQAFRHQFHGFLVEVS